MPASVATRSTVPATFPATVDEAKAAAIAAGVRVGGITEVPDMDTAWFVQVESYGGVSTYVAHVGRDERVAWNVAAQSARYSRTRVEALPLM